MKVKGWYRHHTRKRDVQARPTCFASMVFQEPQSARVTLLLWDEDDTEADELQDVPKLAIAMTPEEALRLSESLQKKVAGLREKGWRPDGEG